MLESRAKSDKVVKQVTTTPSIFLTSLYSTVYLNVTEMFSVKRSYTRSVVTENVLKYSETQVVVENVWSHFRTACWPRYLHNFFLVHLFISCSSKNLLVLKSHDGGNSSDLISVLRKRYFKFIVHNKESLGSGIEKFFKVRGIYFLYSNFFCEFCNWS